MAKWGPGPKKLEKGTSETTPKVLLFHKIVNFFSSYFSVICWSVPRKHFSDFGGQSVPKEGPLGSLFWTFCRKAGKVKPMVWWSQTLLFMVSRRSVRQCWAVCFNWFSKLDPVGSFYGFGSNWGSNRNPNCHFLQKVSVFSGKFFQS